MRIDGITGYIVATLFVTVGFGALMVICTTVTEKALEWAKNRIKKHGEYRR